MWLCHQPSISWTFNQIDMFDPKIHSIFHSAKIFGAHFALNKILHYFFFMSTMFQQLQGMSLRKCQIYNGIK